MIIPPVRQQDPHGAGHYGAPRSGRLHRGIDFAAYPRSKVLSLTHGTVTKLGYPYDGDMFYRYVEVTLDGNRFRYFYLKPLVAVGDVIEPLSVLGEVQDLTTRYAGITPHYHFEIINPAGDHIDPASMFEDIA